MADARAQRPSDNGTTLASLVYRRLLEDILAGRLKPGRKLRLQELKEHYDVGNSPLREALNRLSANGLVTREENRGFRVPPASAQELMELTRTRCWLEEIALRESIRTGDERWEERIVLSYHRLSRTPRGDESSSVRPSPQWEDRHRDYHQALISACNSSMLQEYCVQLHEKTMRYRNLAAVVEYRERHELHEHRSIQEAVLDRDADKAVELLTAHFRVTQEIVICSGTLN